VLNLTLIEIPKEMNTNMGGVERNLSRSAYTIIHTNVFIILSWFCWSAVRKI